MGNNFNLGNPNNRRRHNPNQNNNFSSNEEEIRYDPNNLILASNGNLISDSLFYPRIDSEPIHNQNVIVVEHQKTKSTKSYKNPILLFKSSLKLEKNAMDKNIYFFSFKYTSILNFNVIFHFNSIQKDDKFIINENFPIIRINNISKGNEEIFFDKEAFINSYDYYFNKKEFIISEKGYFDVIIELEAIREDGNIECKFATFCNLVPFKNITENIKNEDNSTPDFSIKIKAESQKLKVKNYWFEMHNIYGLDPSTDSSSNDCEACCVKKKNTIFLPCKHSYACSDCSIVVRLPNNVCPLCRQTVTDSLILGDSK